MKTDYELIINQNLCPEDCIELMMKRMKLGEHSPDFETILTKLKYHLSFENRFKGLQESSDASRISEIYNLMLINNIVPDYPKVFKNNETSKKTRMEGNKFFKKYDFERAMDQYTKAVGEAEIDSEDLFIAYANRSAVNLELRRFDESLNDITRALEGKLTENLKLKLEKRKIDCSKRRTETKPHPQVKFRNIGTFSGLSHPKSDYIDCASNAVDIGYSEQYERMLIAATDIKPGDILAVEKAYVSNVDKDHSLSFCHYCQSICASMIPCLKCTISFYCNENCRDEAWKRDHKIECEILSAIRTLNFTNGELCALKILLKNTQQGQCIKKCIKNERKWSAENCEPRKRGFQDGKYSQTEFAVFHLKSNKNSHPWNFVLEKLIKTCCLLYLLKQTTYFGTEKSIELTKTETSVGEILFDLIFKTQRNSLALASVNVVDLKEEQFGCGIFPFLSLANHACYSNVNKAPFFGNTLVLYAVEPIKKGEQLFDCYQTLHHLPAYLRQQMYSQVWHFHCQCRACVEDWPTQFELPLFGGFLPGSNAQEFFQKLNKFRLLFRHMVLPQEKVAKRDWEFLVSFCIFANEYINKPSQLHLTCTMTLQKLLFSKKV